MIADGLRDAEPDEAATLEGIKRRAALAWEDTRARLLAEADALALAPGGRVRVAVRAGLARGFAVVAGGGGTAELTGLFVEPACWHDGIGRALVEDACALAREDGAAALEVTANPNALEFYEKLGFRPCGEAQTRFGPARRMRRTLS